MATQNGSYKKFLDKFDAFAHEVYRVTRYFPSNEKFGLVSQMRRAALSIPLNYIEGYARGKDSQDNARFLRTAFGSLKEVQYCLTFTREEGYITEEQYTYLNQQADEIGAILWSLLQKV